LEGLSRLNAQENLVGLGILSLKVMAVVGCYDRQRERMSNFQESFIQEQLVVYSVILDFDKESTGVEYLPIFLRRTKGLLHLPPTCIYRDFSLQTATEGNNAFIIFTQKLFIHPGLIIESFEVCEADQLNEIEIAGAILN
jgi:hypothetical protein